ncbi:MAG: WG repeat-containing protein [Flavobacterium sp.]|nr:MAG: WG repeat-containing protein [Flavobacterium sp.]
MKKYLFLLLLLSPIAIYSQQEQQPFKSISSIENPSKWVLVFDEFGLMGYLNSEGKEIVPPIYENIHPFGEYKENWARVVTLEGLTGFIDASGKVVVEPKYEYIEKFGEYKTDWALVSLYDHYGFINSKGEEVVAPIYSEIPLLKR